MQEAIIFIGGLCLLLDVDRRRWCPFIVVN